MPDPRRLPPGPQGIPFFGTIVPYLRDPLGYALRNYRRYGNVVRIDFMGFKGAALHGAAANRFILVDGTDKFAVGPLIERARSRWIVGNGLLFIDDPAHRQQRRLILPAFHRKRLEGYQEVMRTATGTMLDRWRPGMEFDIARQMHQLALVIVGRTLFSMDLTGAAHDLGAAVAEVVHATSDAFRVALAQFPMDFPGGLGNGASLRRALARIHTILGAIIDQHQREGADTGDVVSMLVAARDEADQGLSRAQIQDNLLTLFVAGHETSATALAWTFYLLARHPPVTARLLAELDRELAGRPPTLADFDRLPYLEQVVKEALRLYPPAVSLNRVVVEPFEWEGYPLHRGDLVIYSPFVSHRMPDQFPDPEIFRPERFDPAGGEAIPPYAYIPFGGGPRSCIGAPFAMMEIRTVLAMVLQRYRLALVPGQRIEMTLHTTLQPRYGIRIRLNPQASHPG